MKYLWRWELTLKEIFNGLYLAGEFTPNNVILENQPFKPFSITENKLLFDNFTFQFGISDKSMSEDIKNIRKEQLDLPLSGDKRSGIIAFDNEKIIGSLIIEGNSVKDSTKIAVLKEYRNKGISVALLTEWYWLTKRPVIMPSQGINIISAKTIINSYKNIIDRAKKENKDIPLNVLNSLESEENKKLEMQYTRYTRLPIDFFRNAK